MDTSSRYKGLRFVQGKERDNGEREERRSHHHGEEGETEDQTDANSEEVSLGRLTVC
jgi:hypothetical protein